jgi:hypothetical protein
MKYLPLTLTLLFGLVSADAQVSSGSGIFGFGRKKEQINAGLFPDATSTQPVQVSAPVSSPAPPAAAPTPPPRTSDNIFRGGAPQEIDAVSYVIEDGRKVEKTDKPKKAGFFGFGKKEKTDDAEATPILEPIPTSSYPDPDEATTDPTPEFRAPAPPAISETVQPDADAAVTRATETVAEVADFSPVADDAKEKKSGMFSFFNRKSKQEEPAPVVQPEPVVVNDPAPVEVAAPVSTPTPAQPGATETAPVSTDIPTFAGVETPGTEKSGFSLPNPMKNLKPPSIPLKSLRPPKREKTIDMTGAETIISNGEIVDGQEDIVESNIVTNETGTREAPRIVNGVKTYSSWDDVGGRSISAADKILDQIR